MENSYTALIRAFAAYHMANPQVYHLAIFTFVGVLFLCTSEMFIWRTVRLKEALGVKIRNV